MFNCSIMDYLVGLVIALGDVIINAVNAAWSHVDFGFGAGCFQWFSRLNEFLPVSEFFTILGLLVSLAGISLLIKFGIKCVDWVRG